MKVFSVIIVCLVSTNYAEQFQSTSEQEDRSVSAFQLQVPGSQPITVYEDPTFSADSSEQPLEQYSNRDPKYKITKRVSTAEYYRPDEDTHTISIKPFPLTVQGPSDAMNQLPTASLLEQFLQQYGKDPEKYSDTEKDQMSHSIENYFDDMERKNRRPPLKQNSGWVSLDPVPTYSSAKIYKWNSYAQKFKPNRPSYSQTEWEDDDNYNNQPSFDSTYSETTFNEDRPYQVPPKPFSSHYPNIQKPSYKPYNDIPSRPSFSNEYDDDRHYSGQKKPWNDLITDNRPSNFPVEQSHGHGYAFAETGYKKDKKEHPETYPTSGNGRWVLVSTTRGQQQQSNRNQKSLSSTVPKVRCNICSNAPKNSNSQQKSSPAQPKSSTQPKSSITLQRSPTPEQKKRYRALTEPASVSTVLHVVPGGDTKNITTHNGEVIEVARHSRAGQSFGQPSNTTRLMTKRVQLVPAQDNSGPVFAAVGAGLIPATLSLVAPMVLGRRRRDSNKKSIESQIQREPPFSVTKSYH